MCKYSNSKSNSKFQVSINYRVTLICNGMSISWTGKSLNDDTSYPCIRNDIRDLYEAMSQKVNLVWYSNIAKTMKEFLTTNKTVEKRNLQHIALKGERLNILVEGTIP